jgi:hypothetical protein
VKGKCSAGTTSHAAQSCSPNQRLKSGPYHHG